MVADLDDITTVFIDAFEPGPLWRYYLPFIEQHRAYFWRCTRGDIGEHFGNRSNNTFVNVITVPSNQSAVHEASSSRSKRVVAVAVWNILEANSTAEDRLSMSVAGWGFDPKAKCADHLEANITRAVDAHRQYSIAEERYVLGFKRKQLYLGLLATHPSWDGFGFGAMHVRWGIHLAKRMEVPVTLIATPAGWPLYEELGFSDAANITIKTLDWEEDEDLWFEYMRYETSRNH